MQNINAPTVTHRQLRPHLLTIMGAERERPGGPADPVLIHGEPGIGKTNGWKQVAGVLEYDYRLVHLNQLNPGDVHGLRYPNRDTLTTVQFPPSFLPADDDPPTILVLDELGTCPEQVRKPASEMLTEHRVGERVIDPRHWIVAATNTGDDGALTHPFDTATADRFIHFKLIPHLEQWIADYAIPQKLDERVIAYLRHHPDDFTASGRGEFKTLLIVPTPRSWARVGRLIRGHAELKPIRALIAGIVGSGVATRFVNFAKNSEGLITAGELLAAAPADRAAMLPRTDAGLATLAAALPAFTSDPQHDADLLHITGLVADLPPTAATGGRLAAPEAASWSTGLILERILAREHGPAAIEQLAGNPLCARAFEVSGTARASGTETGTDGDAPADDPFDVPIAAAA